MLGIQWKILFHLVGHLAAPFTAHSFCNHMGCPDLSEVVAVKDPLRRVGLFLLFVIGLVAWCFLLTPMTNPRLFHNNLFWHKHFIWVWFTRNNATNIVRKSNRKKILVYYGLMYDFNKLYCMIFFTRFSLLKIMALLYTFTRTCSGLHNTCEYNFMTECECTFYKLEAN